MGDSGSVARKSDEAEWLLRRVSFRARFGIRKDVSS